LNRAASLDHPVDGQVVGTVVPVYGWVLLDQRPASVIDVFVNDRPAVRARRCEQRVDLVGKTGAAPGDELVAGFRELVALGELAVPGATVTIRVRAMGINGEIWEPAPITVVVGEAARVVPLVLPEPLLGPGTLDRTAEVPADARPRVCVFTHSLRMGGGELYLQELLLRLADAEVATFLVIAPEDGPLRAELELAGIQVHLGGYLPIDPLPYAARRAELGTLLLAWGCDVVVANTLGVFGEVDAAISVGVPVVWSIHESFHLDVFADLNWGDNLRPEIGRRLRQALLQTDVVVFEAEATRELYEQQLPGVAARCIRYGIDLSAIARYEDDHPRDELRAGRGFAPSDRVLLCMGVFQDRKAQLALVHAFAQFVAARPDARLVLVGNHPSDYAFAVGQAIGDLGIAGSVRVIDIHPDTYQWYRCADVLVSASDTESLPRSILESMAFGVPVVGAEVFGLPEVVVDGVNGWLFEPRSEVALLAGLRRVLACSPAELATVSERARHDAIAFDGQGYATDYNQLILDLTADHRARVGAGTGPLVTGGELVS
jgi:D-inositol-3-phosphate glycosyltransferase